MMYLYKDKYEVNIDLEEMKGCCGVVIALAFNVKSQRTDLSISEEEYDKLDHIDFIRTFEKKLLDTVEKFGFTRVILSDVVPDLIKNKQHAYYRNYSRHNEAINLHTVLTDLKWETLPDFINQRTKNTVTLFYKDIND